MRIFEDILDDIDIQSADVEEDVISKIQDNYVDTSIYDYLLYIPIYKEVLELGNKELDDTITSKLKLLKNALNVYLDSYYFNENEILIYDISNIQKYQNINKEFKMFSEEDERLLTDNVLLENCIYYRIYFNFDNNLMHMLKFFYIVTNSITNLEECYRCMIYKRSESKNIIGLINYSESSIKYTKTKYGSFPFSIFLRKKYSKERIITFEEIKQISYMIYDKFGNILKIKQTSNKEEDTITYIRNCVKRFMLYIKKDNARMKDETYI